MAQSFSLFSGPLSRERHIGFNPLTAAFIISFAVHFSAFVSSMRSNSSIDIDPVEYKLVELMDMETPALQSPKTESLEGEIKVVKEAKTEVKEFLKEEVKQQGEENLSHYLPFFRVGRLPEFTEKIRPEYPPGARQTGMEAEVVAEAYIDREGKMRKVVIIKSGGQAFDESVSNALYKSKFKPAFSKEGEAVSVRVRIPFKFELE